MQEWEEGSNSEPFPMITRVMDDLKFRRLSLYSSHTPPIFHPYNSDAHHISQHFHFSPSKGVPSIWHTYLA